MRRRQALWVLATALLPAWAAGATIDAVVFRPGTSLGYDGSIALAYCPLVLFDNGRYSPAPRRRCRRSGRSR